MELAKMNYEAWAAETRQALAEKDQLLAEKQLAMMRLQESVASLAEQLITTRAEVNRLRTEGHEYRAIAENATLKALLRETNDAQMHRASCDHWRIPPRPCNCNFGRIHAALAPQPAPAIVPPCPHKCEVCQSSDHHWMDKCDENGEPIWVCKHCEATKPFEGYGDENVPGEEGQTGNKTLHMQKLELAFFQNLERNNIEYGGIGLDPKRPFGNSDVEGDILEIIAATPEGDDGNGECWSSTQYEYAAELYDNLIPWLQGRYGKADEGQVQP